MYMSLKINVTLKLKHIILCHETRRYLLSRLMNKTFMTEITVNKVQVISVLDCRDKPYTTGFMNFMLSAADG